MHYNDTWIYDPELITWTCVQIPRNEKLPCARERHAATIIDQKMWIFGGQDSGGDSLSDLWAFDIKGVDCYLSELIEDRRWTEISLPSSPSNPKPLPCHGHSLCAY